MLASLRADVDDPVRGLDGVLVVLDDDQRVGQVTQPRQRLDQPLVVPWVQAGRRLVQHVQHPAQPGPDLGGEPDPLCLTAGQRRRRPVQGQIVQPDIHQETEPRLDLGQRPLGDQLLARGQRQGPQPVRRFADRPRGQIRDREAVHRHGQDFRPQPGTVAGRAGHRPQVALVPLPLAVGLGFGVAPLKPRQYAFKPDVVRPVAPGPGPVADVHLVVGAVQHRVLRRGRQFVPRGVHAEAACLRRAAQQPPEVLAVLPAGPGRDRALRQGQLPVRDHQIGVDLPAGAQAGADRAGAQRRVERERARPDVVQRLRVAVRAGQVLGVAALAARVMVRPVDELGDHPAAREPQRCLHRVGETRPAGRLDREPVDDDLDRVRVLAVRLRRFAQRVDDAVDPDPGEALGLQVAEQRGVPARLPRNLRSLQSLQGLPRLRRLRVVQALRGDRRKDVEPGALGLGQDVVDDLLRCLPGDRQAADQAVRLPDPRPEQAQVVIDLGDRAHRGPRVRRGGLLVDRHGRRQADDGVDVGLVELSQKLPGVG